MKTIGGRKLISVRQVHEADVLVLSEKNGDVNKTESLNPVEADAIITDITGLTLLILVADCQPVLLYDFTNKVVANIHSGWRGSVLNIIGKTVDAMAENFGTSPEDVVAGIGPSLGPCCAEFTHYRKEIPNDYWKYKNDLDHFDFWAISRDQLLLKGVKKENIVTGNICTKCNTDTFYSYRKEKTTGRLACTIGLK